MNKCVYKVIIYNKTDGKAFLEGPFDTCKEAKHFIAKNIDQFAEFYPVWRITEDYVKESN